LKIRKGLKLKDHEIFADLSYGNKEIKDVEGKSRFNYLKAYHNIKTVLNKIEKNRIEIYSIDQLNAIGYAFTVYKTDENIKKYLADFNIKSDDLEMLLSGITNFSKFSNLSIKAYAKII